MNAPIYTMLTIQERERYEGDVAQFGERVAAWFISESRGWSALYDMIYWAEVRKHAVSFKEQDRWAA